MSQLPSVLVEGSARELSFMMESSLPRLVQSKSESFANLSYTHATLVAPAPLLARSTSEAERWRLVRELQESSFNGCRKFDDDGVAAEESAEALAMPALKPSKSWWRRQKVAKIDDNVKCPSPSKRRFRVGTPLLQRSMSAPRDIALGQTFDMDDDMMTVASTPNRPPKTRLFGRSRKDTSDGQVVATTKSFSTADSTADILCSIPPPPPLADSSNPERSPQVIASSDPVIQEAPPPAPLGKLERQKSLLTRFLSFRKKKQRFNGVDALPVPPPPLASTPRTARRQLVRKPSSDSNESFDDEIVAFDAETSNHNASGTGMHGNSASAAHLDRWSPISVPTLDTPSGPRRPMRRMLSDNCLSMEDSKDDLVACEVLESLHEEEESADDRASRSVVFDLVIIRQYERTVGDNPSCSSGCPISLGWQYLTAEVYPIDHYELTKPKRRTKKELYLPSGVRNDLLIQEWNCSPEDIRNARREATYIQYCREKSAFSGGRPKEAAYLRKANRKGRRSPPVEGTEPHQPEPRRAVQRQDTPVVLPARAPLSPQPRRMRSTSDFRAAHPVCRRISSEI